MLIDPFFTGNPAFISDRNAAIKGVTHIVLTHGHSDHVGDALDISKQTGARLFEVSKKLPIEEIYRQIQEELRSQYNLGYTPDKATSKIGYHKIHLATKQKDLSVQTREGYYLER